VRHLAHEVELSIGATAIFHLLAKNCINTQMAISSETFT
jgi:hypothetical protein